MFSHGVSQVPRRDGLSHEHSEKVDIPAQRAGLENWLRAWSLLALSAGSFGGLAQQSQWRPASLGSCHGMLRPHSASWNRLGFGAQECSLVFSHSFTLSLSHPLSPPPQGFGLVSLSPHLPSN